MTQLNTQQKEQFRENLEEIYRDRFQELVDVEHREYEKDNGEKGEVSKVILRHHKDKVSTSDLSRQYRVLGVKSLEGRRWELHVSGIKQKHEG